MLEGTPMRHPAENISGTITATAIMADGLAIARLKDRWFPVDELVVAA